MAGAGGGYYHVKCPDPAAFTALMQRERGRISALKQAGAATTLGWSPAQAVLVTDGDPGSAAAAFSGVVSPDNAPIDTVWVKRAVAVRDIAQPFTSAFAALQEAMGGPNALTTTVGGAALGAAAGAGLEHLYDVTGRPLLNALVPGAFNDNERRHARRLAIIGGAGFGAMPGLVRGLVAANNGRDPWPAMSQLYKTAENAGALFAPKIPVDAFNRAIWTDVVSPPNPFGSRTALGEADAPMTTPPHVAAQLSGVLSAAGALTGRERVSPWDIARLAGSAALNAGGSALVGSATGLFAGKMLGALAGLSPAAQQSMRQTGLWTGALTGIARTLF